MKTFMKWVKQCQYKNETVYNEQYQFVEGQFYDNDYKCKCKVRLYGNCKGGYVEDDNGYITKCSNVKDVIGLVKFLTDGTIEL